MSTFDELMMRWRWVAIRGCPGRYVLRDHDVAYDALVTSQTVVREYRVPRARDAVLVAAIPGGGLISYRRADGRFVHTINTPEGFRRKLADLGIDPSKLEFA